MTPSVAEPFVYWQLELSAADVIVKSPVLGANEPSIVRVQLTPDVENAVPLILSVTGAENAVDPPGLTLQAEANVLMPMLAQATLA